ncbi:hypothetical protein BABINDRAFT_38070 [Babjeviella inositovora NRRL Y-12698]|uniref:AB hydrolase-1 domain-containing protein n=1 Tax=Babjeviella inositovora NRRL Y-12698 TaxID=984486 RepID=A0A1E3QNF5_9ASCO|nr:uncharacterized protein BABINDRAFT_38070 [Babjeviella inositovora NRRL Y-12698]ODQ79168.1 hypothetical protein BABINDRAFT_38070 [Babjeviella inositovora NRRL Y-12698]
MLVSVFSRSYTSVSKRGVRLIHNLPTRCPISLSYENLTPKTVTAGDISSSPNAPVIFIHGLFGSKQNFKSVGKSLSRALVAPSYAVDLRNHGLSPHARPFTYEAMARDVVSLLETELQTTKGENIKFTVVGHSMGAKVAMLVSLLSPHLVDKLVVVDNSPVGARLGLSFDQNLKAMQEVEKAKIPSSRKTWRQEAEAIIAKYEKDPNVRMFLMANLSNKPLSIDSPIDFNDGNVHFRLPVNYFGHGSDGLLNLVGDWPAEAVAGSKFTRGTLVLKAKHSTFVNDETLKDFETYFPGYSYEEFDSGHWLITEKPKQFMESVAAFVQG